MVHTQQRMPVLFVGHGSPENALERNEFTNEWRKIGASIPKPRAILCISAHWLTEGTGVTAMERPKTIHDFYGFPEKLYQTEYPARGDPALARRVSVLIKSTDVSLDTEWGLDHGAWSVLAHLYPAAEIPTIQLSINLSLPPERHYRIGTELAPLRDEGVLILGSGNLVHNLRMVRSGAPPYPWAAEFDAFVKERLTTRDDTALINFASHKMAALAHPTDDHYLPFLYTLGTTRGEKPQFSCEKIVYGSLSMRCVRFD